MAGERPDAAGRWIFGYGSLVSPVSFGATLGRPLTHRVDFHYAVLGGFGRRWNYGVGHRTAFRSDTGSEHSLIALGIVAAPDETANGAIGWVTDHELAALDRRERDYDRVTVTDLVDVEADLDAPVEVYVPRPVAVQRYERFRDDGVGAVEQRYWDLVAGAFAAFGADARARYLTTTPPPDVPVLELDLGDR